MEDWAEIRRLHRAEGMPIKAISRRSFCFVIDLIEGLVRPGTLESTPDEPINLGNEREVTIAEIADLVWAMTGSSSGVERSPLPQDDPVRRRPDTTRAREILGWEATVPLTVGGAAVDDRVLQVGAVGH